MTTPRYESGFIIGNHPDGSTRYEAFLRPYSEDWYDLYPAATWWEAMAKGMAIAAERPDCAFVGGLGKAADGPR